MKPRKYLTKSNFKIGLECPRKLYYQNKPDEYLNGKVEDPFLEALAQGGYQVGALAQLKYPNGIMVKEQDHEAALGHTFKIMKDNQATIFEAAFVSEQLFVRSDVAIKTNDSLRIIEVKSKSFDSDDDSDDAFLSPKFSKPGKPKILAKWIPYIYDLAFQVYVARRNYPNLNVSASLMLMDKSVACPVEGLHQLFLVKKSGRSKEVITTKDLSGYLKGTQILREIDVTDLIDQVIDGLEISEFALAGPIQKKAEILSDIFIKNKRFPSSTVVGSHCKKCEFRGEDDVLKSGFDECWVEHANIDSASSKVMSFDLWNFRKGEDAIKNKRFLLEDLSEEDLGKAGKTRDRQLLQIDKFKSGDSSPWFDIEKLRGEIESWKWPLHFIDFETCRPAIPFKKGFSPYSEVAFQFSHHVMQKNGDISHVGEFIDLTPGKFPSFDFVRELKKQLEVDDGTIFRYSSHENSVLNNIVFLLEHSGEADRDDLIRFIKSITKKKASDKKDDFLWLGDRNMVDLLEVVKDCYLSPLMGSSNSLKFVLPAILNESNILQKKYSKPIYGTKQIPSLNFKDHSWITKSGQNFSADPYQQLPPLFSNIDLQSIENLISDEDKIRNGGAAMMAYCRSQFTEMSNAERDLVRAALLKYCELDTLAMVMLVEYWISVV